MKFRAACVLFDEDLDDPEWGEYNTISAAVAAEQCAEEFDYKDDKYRVTEGTEESIRVIVKPTEGGERKLFHISVVRNYLAEELNK